MSDDLISRLYRRLMMAIGRGRLTAVNDAGAVQLVQIKLGADEVRDGMPRVAEFGFASNPPLGSDAVAIFITGDRSSGVVIGTNHQQSRPRNLAPGESQQHDDFGKSIYLTANGGIIVNANGSPVTVNGATTVTINAATKVRMVTPVLEVTGDIHDNCDTQARTMASMRSIYDGHTHPVPNVQAGSSTITTNAPNQQQ